MTSAGTAGVAVSVGCRGDIATGAVGVAISLAGDGERDLENKPELLRTMEEDDGDLLLDGSAGTSLTSDGRSSLLILPCGSHNFVFSLLIVDVLVVVDRRKSPNGLELVWEAEPVEVAVSCNQDQEVGATFAQLNGWALPVWVQAPMITCR